MTNSRNYLTMSKYSTSGDFIHDFITHGVYHVLDRQLEKSKVRVHPLKRGIQHYTSASSALQTRQVLQRSWILMPGVSSYRAARMC